MTHAELVEQAERWLRGVGCSVIITEQRSTCSCEIPDAVGFYSTVSILVECKTSKSDFRNDRHKIVRFEPRLGMGKWRVYLCEEGIIDPKNIPKGWGLVYYINKTNKFKRIAGLPKGNRWTGGSPFESDSWFEKSILLAHIRKLNKRRS